MSEGAVDHTIDEGIDSPAPGVQIHRESITVHIPVLLNCKFKADPELVLRCQGAGQQPLHGLPIGRMPDFYPFLALKRIAMEECQTFVGHMRNQGFEPREAESQMELWGPFREKMDMSRGAALENFEEGNHLIPQGKWRSQAHGAWAPEGTGRAALGPQMLDKERVLHSQDYKHGIAFFIRGRFLASHGKEEEETGTLLVGG